MVGRRLIAWLRACWRRFADWWWVPVLPPSVLPVLPDAGSDPWLEQRTRSLWPLLVSELRRMG